MEIPRTEAEIERGIGAIIAIDDFLGALRKYRDELAEKTDFTKDTFDSGLLTGYNRAIEMMEARAEIYGVFPEAGEEDD